MADATIPQLLEKNAALFLSYEAWSNIQTLIVAGRIDDPASFDAAGGKTGPLGFYPFVNVNGQMVYVPCIARQITLAASGGFSLPTLLAVPAATNAEIAAGPPQLVGVTAAGEMKRFTTDMFADRRTNDLDPIPNSEYAEWLSCLSSTGLERKIAVTALTRSFGDVIDPTRPPFNVRYDAQKMKGVTKTAGSNAIYTEYTTGRFTQADIGKIAVVSNYGPDNGIEAYIGKVDPDGKRAYLFSDLAFTNPVNASSGGAYQEVIWGTDCTAGMQAALDAAEPRAYEGWGGVVALGGFTMVRSLRFGSVSLVGLSTTGCGFYQLASPNAQGAWIAQKTNVGLYNANQRPHHWCLKNLTLFGQRFTVPYSSFRRALEITGSTFANTYLGAPYALIEGVDIFESRYDGFFGDGVFAGLMKDFRVFFAEQVGMRVGFFDLDGVNWHAEGNKRAGIYSTAVGANLNLVRCSYNGAEASNGAAADAHINGANYVEAGGGNTVTNLRLQECWGHSLVFTDRDTNGVRQGAGSKNAFYLGTFDDTGNVSSMLDGNGNRYASARNLPDVRAMIYFYKTADQYNFQSCSRNTVNLTTGAPQVRATTYATNGVGVDGYARGNEVTLRTPDGTNAPADWYAGAATDKVALSPGPWVSKNIGSSTIGGLNNVVTVNRQVAP